MTSQLPLTQEAYDHQVKQLENAISSARTESRAIGLTLDEKVRRLAAVKSREEELRQLRLSYFDRVPSSLRQDA